MIETFTREELARLAAEPYEDRGIPHSEMALIIDWVRRLGIEVMIESGRARAQSTYMLAKYLPHVQIRSVEMRNGPDQAFGIDRISGFENVSLHWGDGSIILPELAAGAGPRRTAVLCDGPKGAAAVDVVRQCFRFPHVRIGFVHDMRRLDHGKPSPHRAAAIAAFPDALFSDEADDLSELDAVVAAARGPCGPSHIQQFGSYGPTVGVFLNPLGDKT